MLSIKNLRKVLEEYHAHSNKEDKEENIRTDMEVIKIWLMRTNQFRIQEVISERIEILSSFYTAYYDTYNEMINDFSRAIDTGEFYSILVYKLSLPRWSRKRDVEQIDIDKANLSCNFYGEYFKKFVRNIDIDRVGAIDNMFIYAWHWHILYLMLIFMECPHVQLVEEENRQRFFGIFNKYVNFSVITGLETSFTFELPTTYNELYNELITISPDSKKEITIKPLLSKHTITFDVHDNYMLYQEYEKYGYSDYSTLRHNKHSLYDSNKDVKKHDLFSLRITPIEEDKNACCMTLRMTGQRMIGLTYALDTTLNRTFKNFYGQGDESLLHNLTFFIMKAILHKSHGIINRSLQPLYTRYIESYGEKKDNRIDILNVILLSEKTVKERNIILRKFIKNSEKEKLYRAEVNKLHRMKVRYISKDPQFAIVKLLARLNLYAF